MAGAPERTSIAVRVESIYVWEMRGSCQGVPDEKVGAVSIQPETNVGSGCARVVLDTPPRLCNRRDLSDAPIKLRMMGDSPWVLQTFHGESTDVVGSVVGVEELVGARLKPLEGTDSSGPGAHNNEGCVYHERTSDKLASIVSG